MSRTVTRWVRSAFILAALLSQAACGAGWHRIDPVPPTTLRPRQQVQVWQGGQKHQLHSVRLSGDSISGVPYIQPPECDSCRVSLPRGSVDSLKAGNPSGGFWKTTALVTGGMLIIAAISCATVEGVCDTD